MGDKSVSASTEIAASPERIYALVSDLPRMGEWSPENVGGTWAGKAEPASVGARFNGKNKNGKKSWSGAVVVTDASPGKRFAFRTVVGPMKIAEWSYDIAATDSGCTVTETWVDTRNALLSMPTLGKMVTGTKDRAPHTRAMIETTLANVKKAAEA